MKPHRRRIALAFLVLLNSYVPRTVVAQASYRVEGSIGAVWGLPLSDPSGAPGLLFRVGVAQAEPKSRLSARLAVEGVSHHRALLDASDSFAVRTLLGFGYDLRLHGAQPPIKHYLLMGAGVYRSLGNRGDGYPFWLLSPRIGWGGEIDKGGLSVGIEASAQYPALTNFGGTGGRLGFMLPVSVTIMY